MGVKSITHVSDRSWAQKVAYKKVLNKKSNRNRYAIPVYIDGIRYESLLAGAIDFELGYPNVFNKYKKAEGAPFSVSGHVIVTVAWSVKHPEYDVNAGELPEGENK